jgi:hypothetical protein
LDFSCLIPKWEIKMSGSDDRHLALLYLSLATGVVLVGTGITFAILAVCAYYGIDITLNWWLMGIPAAASLLINVLLIELYRKLTRR